MDWYFGQKHYKYIMVITNSVLLHKMLTDGLEWCGLRVDYCDVFYQMFGLPFWRHPFTVNNWWANNTTFLQICSDEETNLHIGCPWCWVHFQLYLFIWWTIPLRVLMYSVLTEIMAWMLIDGLAIVLYQKGCKYKIYEKAFFCPKTTPMHFRVKGTLYQSILFCYRKAIQCIEQFVWLSFSRAPCKDHSLDLWNSVSRCSLNSWCEGTRGWRLFGNFCSSSFSLACYTCVLKLQCVISAPLTSPNRMYKERNILYAMIYRFFCSHSLLSVVHFKRSCSLTNEYSLK